MNKLRKLVFLLFLGKFSVGLTLGENQLSLHDLQNCKDTACLNKEIASVISSSQNASELEQHFSQLLQIAKKLNYKSGLAKIYLQRGISFYKIGRYTEAINDYRESLKFRNEKAEHKEISRTYNNLALAYADMSNFSEALQFHHKSFQLRKENKDTIGMAASLMNIGLLYERQGKHEISQKHYLNSLAIREILKDTDGIASCLNNIGTSFFYLGKIEKSMDYYRRSLAISKQIKNELHIGKSLGNIGMLHDQLKQFDSALVYYQKSLDCFIKLQSTFQIATLYNNLALVYTNLSKNDSAVYYHELSMELKEKLNDYSGLATTLINLGNLHLNNKENEKAFNNYKKGLEISLRLQQRLLIMNAYNGLSEYYRQKGDYKNCFINYQQGILYKDSIYNLEKTTVINELESRYNTKKSEYRLMEKDLQLSKQKLISNMQENRFYVSLIIIVVILIVSFILFIYYRRIKSLNSKLNFKNHENELLMREINHRVKNNLQLVSGLLKLPQKDINSENAKLIMQETRNRVNAISIIHKALYKEENSLTQINMQEYIRELSQNIIHTLSNKNIKCTTEIDAVFLDVDTAIPLALITNELITNSLKHAFSNVDQPKILIQLKHQLNEIHLLIEDNGVGAEVHTDMSENSSFGTRLIKTLSEQINAKYSLTFNRGMQFQCTFQIQSS